MPGDLLQRELGQCVVSPFVLLTVWEYRLAIVFHYYENTQHSMIIRDTAYQGQYQIPPRMVD